MLKFAKRSCFKGRSFKLFVTSWLTGGLILVFCCYWWKHIDDLKGLEYFKTFEVFISQFGCTMKMMNSLFKKCSVILKGSQLFINISNYHFRMRLIWPGRSIPNDSKNICGFQQECKCWKNSQEQNNCWCTGQVRCPGQISNDKLQIHSLNNNMLRVYGVPFPADLDDE